MALIRPKKNDIARYLRMLYLHTEKSLVNEIKRLQESGFVDYGTYASLMRVQAILQEMQDESFQYVPQMVEKVFRDANSRLGYKAAEALSVPQTAIVEQLTANLLGNITEAAETAFKTSEGIMQIGRLHPDAFRNPTIAASLLREAGGSIGQTPVENALKALNQQSITSFVDKSGREWGLTDYCTMATRTVTNQATVAAELTADEWDLWQIVKIGTTCPVCAAYEGRVYSKSGTNPDYPPLSMAFGKIDAAGGNDLANTYLNIHPNCLHTLVKYTTMGKTDKQIERDKEFSSFEKRPANVDYRSKKQIAAYREKEKTRAEYLETRRQWNMYRERLGDKVPSLETFEKHKKLNDDTYKAWMKAYRAKGAELRKEAPPVVKPKEPQKTPEQWRQEYERAKADRLRVTAKLSLEEQTIRTAQAQNRDLKARIDQFPDSHYVSQYRRRIALNEATIRDVQVKVDALRAEQLQLTQTQFKAEDALVKNFLSGANKIENPGMAEALKNVNPNFDRSRTSGFKPYNNNCQRCIFVYEARRRGYDVEALPSFVGDKWPKAYNYFQFLQDGDKITPLVSNASTSKKFKAGIEEQMRQFGDGSRAVIRVGWKGRNFGHVFIAEQVNGKTRFIDPQTGSDDVSWYFDKIMPSRSYMFRVDDKKFSPNIEEAFKRKGKK